MPAEKIIERQWRHERTALELHDASKLECFTKGFEAAAAVYMRRMRNYLRYRRRMLTERNIKDALDGRLEGVHVMPKQLAASQNAAHMALICAVDDMEQTFKNEWWDLKDDQLEREAKNER